jgi:hypothetical protein
VLDLLLADGKLIAFDIPQRFIVWIFFKAAYNGVSRCNELETFQQGVLAGESGSMAFSL